MPDFRPLFRLARLLTLCFGRRQKKVEQPEVKEEQVEGTPCADCWCLPQAPPSFSHLEDPRTAPTKYGLI
ncbi:hypothetical protein FDECE_13846 [Fusarium decemcellulare]|nr:hypothetical protein FDECE_13846 [Fusarium decemcellulare]